MGKDPDIYMLKYDEHFSVRIICSMESFHHFNEYPFCVMLHLQQQQ